MEWQVWLLVIKVFIFYLFVIHLILKNITLLFKKLYLLYFFIIIFYNIFYKFSCLL
jgi:hypothetical protein